MMVDLKDGRCNSCDGQLQIIDADDATMTCECTECGNEMTVEHDAFSDGAVHYLPEFLSGRMAAGELE